MAGLQDLSFDTVGEVQSGGRQRKPTRSILTGNLLANGDAMLTIDGKYVVGIRGAEWHALTPAQKDAVRSLVIDSLKGYKPAEQGTTGELVGEELYKGMKTDALKSIVRKRKIKLESGASDDDMRRAILADDAIRLLTGDPFVSESDEESAGSKAGPEAVPGSAQSTPAATTGAGRSGNGK
jgi:hypothetical protein